MAGSALARRYRCVYCGKSFLHGRQVLGHVVGKHIGKTRLKDATIQTSHLTPLQVGYLSAFLDGEGGIQINRTKRKRRAYSISLHPMVYFTNTDRVAIETLRAWLRAGTVVVSRQRPGCKTMHILHITGIRNIVRLLFALESSLIIKKDRARVMLEFCLSRLGPRGDGGRRFSPRELRLYRSLKSLNKRGRR